MFFPLGKSKINRCPGDAKLAFSVEDQQALSPAPLISGIHRFGPFEANLRTRELRKFGARLKIQDQPFQILAALLERPGDLVTREELQQRIWPADTFVDFDHSLNTSINKLREALSDSAATPRYIETLPRRGYRLLVPVESPPPASITAPPQAEGVSAGEAQPADSGADEKAPQSGARANSGVPGTIARGPARLLFNLIQVMYLSFYILAVGHLHAVHNLADAFWPEGATALIVVITVTGIVGIAVRLFFFSVVSFDASHFGGMYRKLFPALMPLDAFWALSPFLISHRIGAGFALVACTTLLWIPFAQRTLVRMAYGESRPLDNPWSRPGELP